MKRGIIAVLMCLAMTACVGDGGDDDGNGPEGEQVPIDPENMIDDLEDGDDAIISTEKDVISERYRESSEYYNCQIKPNAIGRYQLIFDVVPNPTIPTDVDVRVVSAQYP